MIHLKNTWLKWLFLKIDWLLKKGTVLLRLLWYLFPSFFFLTAGFACFWLLSQGQDVLISAIEKKYANLVVLLALVFWVLVTWYTGRILIYHSASLYKASRTLAHHTPRVMGFLIFSMVWVSLLQVPSLPKHEFNYHFSTTTGYALLAASFFCYILLYRVFKYFRIKYLLENEQSNTQLDKQRKWIVRIVFITLMLMLLVIAIFNFLWDDGTLLVLSMILLQVMYLFAVVWRRGTLDYNNQPLISGKSCLEWIRHERATYPWNPTVQKTLGKICPEWFKKSCYSILYYTNISYKERRFFIFFNIVSAAAVFYYGRAILNMKAANSMGTYPFIMLAFGVLVGFFALVSTISVLRKINFHILLFIVVLIMGKAREPHNVRTMYDSVTTPNLLKRPTLQTYFFNWVNQEDRKKQLLDTSRKQYPVFFVLSDGGASRSGYWTAGALGKIEDETKGAFSKHLFCLSGTSGGGVGVGTFFALLTEKEKMAGFSYEKRAKEFLKNDFLTYTLTRMLGPDFFGPLLPTVKTVSDRAGALEKGMEQGMEDTVFLKHKMAVSFSKFIPGEGAASINLPILCINTTRMQDGRPGVITNINIKKNTELFSKRVDVVGLLGANQDFRLSTVVAMGARFPYISPAGRVNELMKDSSMKAHYFVDGGYFDNSGAGVVNEMIVELARLSDSAYNANKTENAHFKKLQFYVLHATNSPTGDAMVEEVHYIQNDLASPLLTLIGAYGTQTDVNNLRLKKYMSSRYTDTLHYFNIDLYYNVRPDTLSFPMNWTISEYYQQRMNEQLDTSRQVRRTIAWLQSKLW
jgi:hypothetical protein